MNEKSESNQGLAEEKSLRPWHEVARLYNERNGTRITRQAAWTAGQRALRKIRHQLRHILKNMEAQANANLTHKQLQRQHGDCEHGRDLLDSSIGAWHAYSAIIMHNKDRIEVRESIQTIEAMLAEAQKRGQ